MDGQDQRRTVACSAFYNDPFGRADRVCYTNFVLGTFQLACILSSEALVTEHEAVDRVTEGLGSSTSPNSSKLRRKV